MVGVDVGGTHGSSLGRRGFRLAAQVFGDYRSGSAGPRRPGLRRTGSRDPATPAAGIRFLRMIPVDDPAARLFARCRAAKQPS